MYFTLHFFQLKFFLRILFRYKTLGTMVMDKISNGLTNTYNNIITIMFYSLLIQFMCVFVVFTSITYMYTLLI